MLPKMFIFVLFSFVLFQSSSGVSPLNDRPIIGIVTVETNSTITPNATSYMMASYVKFVEASGGRVVPIWIRKPKKYYQDIMSKINGVLFPGGAALIKSNGYGRTGKFIFDIAVEMNDKGDFFPLWGTCLGFELLNYLAAKEDLMLRCAALDLPTTIDFVEGAENSRLFGNLDPRLKNIMETQNVTFHYHRWCLTLANYSASHLDEYFRVVSTNKDYNGIEFISIIEAYKYPFYGVAFHPEKIMFEWAKTKNIQNIPHTSEAVQVSQHLSRFFIDEARKSTHKFPSKAEEDAVLIYNYNPVFTGKNPHNRVTQLYYF